MRLGAFSISLAVKDIAASRAFYEAIGFTTMGGDQARGWLILKSDSTVIGLFQGMFPTNTLTFNPGWDQDAKPLAEFTDVRELQQRFRERGLTFTAVAKDGSGPAHFALVDPDGNPVLFDQHV